MKEAICSAFKQLGFRTVKFSDTLYGFSYGLLKLIYRVFPDQTDYVDIGMDVQSVAGWDEITAYKVVNHLNFNMKYLKSYIYEERIWIVYERNITNVEDVKPFIQYIIGCMTDALRFYSNIALPRPLKQNHES